MPRPAPPTRPRLAALPLVALLTLATACSNGSDAKPPTADETTSSSTSPAKRSTATLAGGTDSPRGEAQTAAVTAFESATTTYFELAQNPGQPTERLSANRTGLSLMRTQTLLTNFAGNGISVRFPRGEVPRPNITNVDQEDHDILITACVIDNGVQVRASDGAVLNDVVVSQLSRARMKLQDGAWKIDSQEEITKWTDNGGCVR